MDPSVISPYPSLEALGSSSSEYSEREDAGDPDVEVPKADGAENREEARRLRGPSTSQSEVRPQSRNVFLST